MWSSSVACQHIKIATCEAVCLYCDVRKCFVLQALSFKTATVKWQMLCMNACLLCHFLLRCAVFGQASSDVSEKSNFQHASFKQMSSDSDDSPHTPVSALNLIL